MCKIQILVDFEQFCHFDFKNGFISYIIAHAYFSKSSGVSVKDAKNVKNTDVQYTL